MADNLKIGKRNINISDIRDVALFFKGVEISGEVRPLLQKNFNYLKERSRTEVVYGINTGFGPMAHVFISEEKQLELQYNLIRSHAVGLGDHMSVAQIRSIMLVRLQTLLKSHSGVTSEVCKLLAEFLNRGITPVVYKHGSVGASGDLVQLAHIAQALIGEGQVLYNGEIRDTKEIFKSVLSKDRILPLQIALREGLALINGTASMTGIGALDIYHAKNILNCSILSSAILFEIVQASEDYFSKEISIVRPHKGQSQVGKLFRGILKKSKLICRNDIRLKNGLTHESTAVMDRHRQEIYSIRCAIQILGPVFDQLVQSQEVLEVEMNSVTDNPVTFTGSKIVHGGNFHGDYVSFEMDKIKIAMTKLSMFSERKINFLFNDKVNKIFTPFLNLATPGLDLGLQGLQFVATSTVAENQSLSSSVYIHSIPTNNDNQDIVSMGTNSALLTDVVIRNTREVVAIELLSVVRAVYLLGILNSMSPKTREFYKRISKVVRLDQDLIVREDVEKVVKLIEIEEFSI
jgi:histidine ammonia-lyase